MNLLLDTHTVLWFFWDDPRLSAAARALLVDPANRKRVSLVSCWEITLKASLGKLSLGEAAQSFLPREIAGNNFDLLGITLDHVTSVEGLPFHHRDPFDRLLIAQAIVENLPIVSVDVTLDSYGVTRLW